jgi:hypothetical protein
LGRGDLQIPHFWCHRTEPFYLAKVEITWIESTLYSWKTTFDIDNDWSRAYISTVNLSGKDRFRQGSGAGHTGAYRAIKSDEGALQLPWWLYGLKIVSSHRHTFHNYQKYPIISPP